MRKSAIKLLFLLLISSSCSPIFVIKATLFEADILLKREDIADILKQDTVDQETKEKLTLVLEARDFSKEIGLEPKGSFSKYSKINNENLLWVLSASKKDKLEAKFWWFPIVGNIPYKGFFSKEDAIKSAKKLETQGYDTYLRSSDAFSTLGWFDDPILSTTLSRGKLTVVNTVIHEIVHNTIWVKNNAFFNETMANAVAALATIEFYKNKDSSLHEKSKEWLERERIFSTLLNTTINQLKTLYSSEIEEPKLLEKKEVILNNYKNEFEKISSRKDQKNINNAYILAQEIYYKDFNSFIEKYDLKDKSLKRMITYLKDVSLREEPYRIINE